MAQQPDLNQAKSYLDQLDLDYISRVMCAAHYPLPRWQYNKAKICEQQYRRYLWLLVKYRGEPLVPTKAIDEFWHNHILYTKRYHQDCQQLVGNYIHHHPTDPAQGDLGKMAKGFERTKELYLAEFGEPLQVLSEKH